ncbi:MAG: hypothetical protein JWN17_264 [Frankiales bacterium]|nr:hypothetical protein [Frankiales bacterium]
MIGNGDQVEPLAAEMASGAEAATAWGAHTYEPDPPIFTPRIWVAVRHTDGALLVGSVRRSTRSGGGADRMLLMPESVEAGEGILLTTYEGTPEDVVTSGLPRNVTTSAGDQDELLDQVWSALQPDLAVAALATAADDLAPTLRSAP